MNAAAMATDRSRAALVPAIAHARHLLPAQGPIGVFIHHNTLHAFEDLPFDEAVVAAGRLYGAEPYLREADYHQAMLRGRITTADLDAVIADEEDAVGSLTAVHGTLAGRAAADAKTSLAHAALTQVGLLFVEIGLGLTTLAMVHAMGHALARTLQFLRAPSMLHDDHQVRAAAGGHLAPTGTHLERLFPERLQRQLYRLALDRGHLDTLLDRGVVMPLTALSRALGRLDDWRGRQRAERPHAISINTARLKEGIDG